MNIVISGAGGFLGTHLIDAYLDRDVSIHAIDFNPETILDKHTNTNLYVYDVNEYKTIDWSDIDVFINCAFPRNSDGRNMAKGLDFIYQILSDAVNHRVKSIINISSQSLYDDQRQLPAREDSEIVLNSVYATGKYASELMTASICQSIPYTNIRMASLIGPYFDQRITNKMVDAAMKNHMITVYDNQKEFSFLDVRDAVKGIVSISYTDSEKWLPVVNLGRTETYTLKQLAYTIQDILSPEIECDIEIKEDEGYMNSSLNIDKLKELTGFIPEISIEESIETIVQTKR